MPLLTTNPFLIENPLWLATVVLIIPTTILAMIGPAIVRRFVPLQHLQSNNEVAGFKFATVGVIYAVLLAFAILVVWERFNQADTDVAAEASAAATIFRLAQNLDAPHGSAIRVATTAYLASWRRTLLASPIQAWKANDPTQNSNSSRSLASARGPL